MEQCQKYIRNSHRCIYTSSYDRGLVYLLNMWPSVRKEIPNAELVICYGWNLFDVIHKDNPARMKWKQQVVELMRQPGIIHLGRIGHMELWKELFSAAVHAYPSSFEEISCISCMKSQCAGAIPVCTTIGALNETVRNGIKVDVDITTKEGQEEYKKQLIKILRDHKMQEEIRKPMMEWAKGYFLWSKIASQWDQLLRINIQNPTLSKESKGV